MSREKRGGLPTVLEASVKAKTPWIFRGVKQCNRDTLAPTEAPS